MLCIIECNTKCSLHLHGNSQGCQHMACSSTSLCTDLAQSTQQTWVISQPQERPKALVYQARAVTRSLKLVKGRLRS